MLIPGDRCRFMVNSTLSQFRRKPSKAATLKSQIREMALLVGPNAKLPTRDELCERLGTSRATIDGVLKVLEAENTIFRKRGSGIYVSPMVDCNNIRVLINASLVESGNMSPFWGLLWGKIVVEGQKRSAYKNEDIRYELVAQEPNSRKYIPDDVMSGIEAGRIHGVLSIGMPDWQMENDLEPHIPMVAYAGPGYWHVEGRTDPAIRGAVERLAARGCRRIAYWRPYLPGGTVYRSLADYLADKYETVKVALAEHGLEYNTELHRYGAVTIAELGGDWLDRVCAAARPFSQDQGYDAVMRAFSGGRDNAPDGLIIGDDMMTSGAIRGLLKLGLWPGKDVAVASHSNVGSPLLHGWEEDLILWQMDAGELATALFSLLDQVMAGEVPEAQVRYVDECFPE
jgi:DNA-binding LacI/PurR family transcriptional regulator